MSGSGADIPLKRIESRAKGVEGCHLFEEVEPDIAIRSVGKVCE